MYSGVMRASAKLADKHYRLDARKIKRAQRALGAATETETIDKALDQVIAEDERNRAAREANERFIKSGIQIRDVFGRLEQ